MLVNFYELGRYFYAKATKTPNSKTAGKMGIREFRSGDTHPSQIRLRAALRKADRHPMPGRYRLERTRHPIRSVSVIEFQRQHPRGLQTQAERDRK